MGAVKYHKTKKGQWAECHANDRPCPKKGQHRTTLPFTSVQDVFKKLDSSHKATTKPITRKATVPTALKNLKVLRKISPHPDITVNLQHLGFSSVPVYELSGENASFFREKMERVKENNPYSACVYVYSEEEYENMRMFVTADGKSGFALKTDGDIVSVFSCKDASDKKVSYSLLSTAVSQGGRKLDCYDTILPKIYSAVGFKETERMTWNDEYAPEGWDKEFYNSYNNGEPDVVMMEWVKP